MWFKHLQFCHIYAVWNTAVNYIFLALCVVKPLYRFDFLLLHGDVRLINIKPQQKHLTYLVVKKSLSVKDLIRMMSVQSAVDKL